MLTRALFFTAGMPQSIVDACHVRLQNESYLAFLDVPAPSRRRAYGTRAEIFDSMGHDTMLEQGWERVADRIHAWVQ